MNREFALNYMNELFDSINEYGVENTASFIFRRDLADTLIGRYGWQPENATAVAYKMTVELPMDLYDTNPEDINKLNDNLAGMLDQIESLLAKEYCDNKKQYEIALDALLSNLIRVVLEA